MKPGWHPIENVILFIWIFCSFSIVCQSGYICSLFGTYKEKTMRKWSSMYWGCFSWQLQSVMYVKRWRIWSKALKVAEYSKKSVKVNIFVHELTCPHLSRFMVATMRHSQSTNGRSNNDNGLWDKGIKLGTSCFQPTGSKVTLQTWKFSMLFSLI